MSKWYEKAVFYHIYPLGLLGTVKTNDGVLCHRFNDLKGWIPHMNKLGINATYIGPLFESSTHGYDTKDYRLVDKRIGTNEEFKDFVNACHENGIKVVVDGVLNHVSREFFAFQDVIEKRWDSPYKDWFKIDFGGNSCYNDGFYYQGWEGHYELVELNHENYDLQQYLLQSVSYWIDEFDIDGIRLDVAYRLPRWFMAMLKDHVNHKKEDFFLLGEVLGDNAGFMFTEAHLDSITDYPGFKGLWSSLNNLNMFEMAHTIKRNYSEMYRGQQLYSFLDNHDVTRFATKLNDKDKLSLAYGLLFSLPGIPSIYYGSEWAIEGDKAPTDDYGLRPEIKEPIFNELTYDIQKYIEIHNNVEPLQTGSFEQLTLQNQYMAFARTLNNQRVIVCVNISDQYVDFHFNGDAYDLIDQQDVNLSNITLSPKSIKYFYVK